MSPISDTRLRTRQAAANLVASGRRPHELTVDLIYAEIRQGSRTTINDELKLWKDEQAKVDALSAAMPAPVANSMLALWAVAVEQGETVFEQRRVEVEGEMAELARQVQVITEALSEAKSNNQRLKEAAEHMRTETIAAGAELQREREARNAEAAHHAQVQQRFADDQLEAQRRFDAQRQAYESQLGQQREQLAASELVLRQELSLATERLDGVQKHVMRQVAEAREAQRRAEHQFAKAEKRLETQTTELDALRAKVVALSTQLQRSTQDLATTTDRTAVLQIERDDLALRLATMAGRLEAVTQQAVDLAARLEAPLATKKRARSSLGSAEK